MAAASTGTIAGSRLDATEGRPRSVALHSSPLFSAAQDLRAIELFEKLKAAVIEVKALEKVSI